MKISLPTLSVVAFVFCGKLIACHASCGCEASPVLSTASGGVMLSGTTPPGSCESETGECNLSGSKCTFSGLFLSDEITGELVFEVPTMEVNCGDETTFTASGGIMLNLNCGECEEDECPHDPMKIHPGECGCGEEETGDSDMDGVHDCKDECPYDPNKILPGECGCGEEETGDSDGDGVHDCNDECPDDPDKILPGECGCGEEETGDSDGDGVHDCNDECPDDPMKIHPGECGCGEEETGDSDGDGVHDCNDDCPTDPDKIAPGDCGCGEEETPDCGGDGGGGGGGDDGDGGGDDGGDGGDGGGGSGGGGGGSGGAGGEPHFHTIHGDYFDYHGVCDLVLVHSASFGSGMGLDIHIRTEEYEESYSIISNAALRIGSDVLEVFSNGSHMINGVFDATLPKTLGGKYTVTTNGDKEAQVFFSDVSHGFTKPELKDSVLFTIDLGDDEYIEIQAWKSFLWVTVHGSDFNFHDGVGLMGTWRKAGMIARDGNHNLRDPIEFAEEWQVLGTEPKLFETVRAPQHPEACLPAKKISVSRRLGQQSVAEEACARVKGPKREFCIFDVMVTGDTSIAEVYFS